MGKWSIVTLGEVATVVSGSTPKTSVNEYWDGEYNWITPAELKDTIHVINETERKITEEAIKDTSLKLLPIGTVLLSSRAPIGKVAIAGVEMYCNQGFKNLICSKKIYNKYLFWFLKGKTEFLNSLGRGATFKEISKTIVEKIHIPLPPLETQKQIAKTLDTAAELLAMYKQQITELDNLIKSIFYDMFGDPITNTKHWKLVKIGDIGKLNSGGTPTRTNPKYFLGDIDWYSAGELNERYLNESKEKLTIEGLENSSAKVFNNGTMLIGMYDTAAFKLGILTKKSSSNQACANIEVKKAFVNIEWLYDCAQIMRPFFLENRRGVRQKNLNLGMIKNLEIPLPPLHLQNQFASIVTKIEEQKTRVKKAIDETQYLFDCLMSEYFE